MEPFADNNLAWFAGLFVGEGNARISRTQVVMTVSMTTKDTIEQIMERIGRGKIYGPYGPTKGGRDVWRWQISDMTELRELGTAMRPWLDEAKRRQIDMVMAFIDERRKPKVCATCGIEFGHRSLKKKYCSDACNMRAYLDRDDNRKRKNEERRRRRLEEVGGSYDRTCPTCEAVFTPRANGTIFCSKECALQKFALVCAWCSKPFRSAIATTACCSKSCAGYVREKERRALASS